LQSPQLCVQPFVEVHSLSQPLANAKDTAKTDILRASRIEAILGFYDTALNETDDV
jgi:hypothetical protein